MEQVLQEKAKFVNVFVSGCIGVGKSTCLDYLKKRFIGNNDIYFIQEYIDFDPNGKMYLQQFLDGSFGLKEFQLYIVDQFWKQLQIIHEKQVTRTCVIVWERHPEEALQVFARSLNKDDKELVFKAIKNMLKTFNIPRLKGNEITYISCFDTRLLTPLHISEYVYQTILDLIASSQSLSAWIHLHCDLSGVEQYTRIRRRGRECEIEEYSDLKKLTKLNVYYWYLYKRLKLESGDYLCSLFEENVEVPRFEQQINDLLNDSNESQIGED